MPAKYVALQSERKYYQKVIVIVKEHVCYCFSCVISVCLWKVIFHPVMRFIWLARDHLYISRGDHTLHEFFFCQFLLCTLASTDIWSGPLRRNWNVTLVSDSDHITVQDTIRDASEHDGESEQERTPQNCFCPNYLTEL